VSEDTTLRFIHQDRPAPIDVPDAIPVPPRYAASSTPTPCSGRRSTLPRLPVRMSSPNVGPVEANSHCCCQTVTTRPPVSNTTTDELDPRPPRIGGLAVSGPTQAYLTHTCPLSDRIEVPECHTTLVRYVYAGSMTTSGEHRAPRWRRGSGLHRCATRDEAEGGTPRPFGIAPQDRRQPWSTICLQSRRDNHNVW